MTDFEHLLKLRREGQVNLTRVGALHNPNSRQSGGRQSQRFDEHLNGICAIFFKIHATRMASRNGVRDDRQLADRRVAILVSRIDALDDDLNPPSFDRPGERKRLLAKAILERK